MRRPARRGEVWLVDLGMVQKTRPALVLSIGFLDHERTVVSYVPRTTSIRDTRFEVEHVGHGFGAGAFDAQGIGGVPAVKLMRKLGEVDEATLERVEAAVRAWLGLA